MLSTHHIKAMTARLLQWDATMTRGEARAIMARHGDRPAIKAGPPTPAAAGSPSSYPVAVMFP